MATGMLEAVAVLVVFCVGGAVWGAPESILRIEGECWTNGTHYGDTAHPQYATQLPPCWQAICHPEQKSVTVATPCTAGPDINYSAEGRRALFVRHCYPSGRGELPGDQCCGGYPICAHDGVNRDKFDIQHFLDALFDSRT